MQIGSISISASYSIGNLSTSHDKKDWRLTIEHLIHFICNNYYARSWIWFPGTNIQFFTQNPKLDSYSRPYSMSFIIFRGQQIFFNSSILIYPLHILKAIILHINILAEKKHQAPTSFFHYLQMHRLKIIVITSA